MIFIVKRLLVEMKMLRMVVGLMLVAMVVVVETIILMMPEGKR
jgi:type IV secretory pathway component VirB8